MTEGDSAKNFAVAGISVVGRKNYGVYPIRGKFLNVRGMKPVDVAKNKEASELLGILGLQLNHEYTKAEALRLPYRHLVILADQDVDGSHIAGLLMNFVAVCAPSLLRVLPDFVCRFATALIRVRQPGGKQDLSFYTEEAYKAELDAGRAKGVASYYKGLGTSSNAQAKEYFRDLKRNMIAIRRDDDRCDDSLDLFFNSKRSDDRKASIAQCESVAPLDYSLENTNFAEFVQRELLPSYAKASIERAIPRLEDGLKPSGRKALWAARKVLREPISVANAAGSSRRSRTTTTAEQQWKERSSIWRSITSARRTSTCSRRSGSLALATRTRPPPRPIRRSRSKRSPTSCSHLRTRRSSHTSRTKASSSSLKSLSA